MNSPAYSIGQKVYLLSDEGNSDFLKEGMIGGIEIRDGEIFYYFLGEAFREMDVFASRDTATDELVRRANERAKIPA